MPDHAQCITGDSCVLMLAVTAAVNADGSKVAGLAWKGLLNITVPGPWGFTAKCQVISVLSRGLAERDATGWFTSQPSLQQCSLLHCST